MATDPQIRAWAKETGLTASVRGPVTAQLRAEYETAHPEADPGPVPGEDDFAEPGPPPDVAERTPRSVAATSARGRLTALRGRAGGGKAKGKGKSRARVPVDDLIAAVWRGLAGFARPLPPTSRLLKVQAPVAGIILEDTVKGTVVDRVLQPFARTSKSAEAIFALAGPPVLITAMQLQPDAAPLIAPLLRESLLMWGKIAGPKMEQAMKRESDFAENFGPVDDLMAFLFAEPGDAAAEDQAVRAQQESMAGG